MTDKRKLPDSGPTETEWAEFMRYVEAIGLLRRTGEFRDGQPLFERTELGHEDVRAGRRQPDDRGEKQMTDDRKLPDSEFESEPPIDVWQTFLDMERQGLLRRTGEFRRGQPVFALTELGHAAARENERLGLTELGEDKSDDRKH